MNNISLFKFSRYFFALFLLVTVLPLLGVFIWSDYDLQRNMSERQQHILGFVSQDTLGLYQSYLSSEEKEIDVLLKNFSYKATSLSEYQKLLNDYDISLLDSPKAKTFLKARGVEESLKRLKANKSHGDYFVNGKTLSAFFVVPFPDHQKGLLLSKAVPVDNLFPQGPFMVEIFAGLSQAPSKRIAAKTKPFFGPPGGPPGPPGFMGHHPPPFGHDGPPPFPPPGDMPPGMGHPPGGFGHHKPPFEDCESFSFFKQEPASKVVHLKNGVGQIVATIRLKMFSPHPHENSGGMNQWMSLIILLTGMVSCLLAGQYLHRNFIVPLMRLSEAAKRVSHGDFNHALNIADVKQPEVRETLENFNTMLSGLTEKEALRNNFISNLTHDFRTPLIAQTRSLELLVKEFQNLGLDEPEKLAKGILKNNDHLLVMVNQLLETYQMDAESMALSLTSINLPTLVEECFEHIGSLAQERQITLSQSFAPDFPQIQADAYYLKRVFINLLANAIDNIPKGKTVTVTGNILNQSDRVEIHIQDNGPGISKEDQQHLFERYYAGSGDTRKLGSGLGLYICAVLTEAHQGKLSVKSEQGSGEENRGTDFIIELPLSP